MKKALVPFLAFLGAILAGSAIISASNNVASNSAKDPALAAPEQTSTSVHASAQPASSTEGSGQGLSPAADSRLGGGQVFRSLRISPRRSPLKLEKPRAPVPEKNPDVHLSCSETLSRTASTSSRAVPQPLALPQDIPSGITEVESAKPTTTSETTFAFGPGVNHLSRWQGSARTENRPVPYINLNWRDQLEFSTVKGLIIDLIHGEQWHGGLIGTLVWGRSRKDLAGLQVPTLRNTLQGGLYLEYALTPQATLGVRVRHDLQNTGVSYGEIFGELELPKLGYLEHNLRLSLEGMNQNGMRRFFGLSAEDAARLGVSAYQPGTATSKTLISYEGFQPTSTSTGIAFGANIGRLSSTAANSPLVRNFGSRKQKEILAAFVVHF